MKVRRSRCASLSMSLWPIRSHSSGVVVHQEDNGLGVRHPMIHLSNTQTSVPPLSLSLHMARFWLMMLRKGMLGRLRSDVVSRQAQERCGRQARPDMVVRKMLQLPP